MSDVVIEFDESELDADLSGGTPADNGGADTGTKPADTKPADNGGKGSFGIDDTEDDLEKGKGNGNGNGNGNDDGGATTDIKPGATNAELAAIHGVTEDEIALAKNMGWTPKERFRGDPKDWKDPKEFIRITEESAPVMRERLRALSKEMNSMKSTIPTLLQMQTKQYKDQIFRLEEEKKDLAKQLEEAHYLADSKRAADLTRRVIENELKTEMTKEEIKRIENSEQFKGMTGDKVVTPSGIDVEREKTWRNEMWPKLTLAQRQTFKEAADFLALPINGDQTTEQRIAYIEERLFGRSNPTTTPTNRSTPPSFAPVARPSANNTASGNNDEDDEFAGWNSMTAEEKKLAIEIIEDRPWFQKRKTDAASAKEWADYKRSFKKGE
jgi:hypothetical protein